MNKEENDLLEALKFELEFFEKGGYYPSPREPWKLHYIFEDSPTCMNYHSKGNPAPCSECALIDLVPPEARSQAIPCRHIPLNAQGETLALLYSYADQRELGDVYGNWLRATIAALGEARQKPVANQGDARPQPSKRGPGNRFSESCIRSAPILSARWLFTGWPAGGSSVFVPGRCPRQRSEKPK